MPDCALESRFVNLALMNPVNRTILERASALGLPDWWLVSGCLFQTAWNGLCGRPPTAGIRDYDLFYFEDGDLSWEAEDRIICRCAEAFRDVGAPVEVRNQARVHLWYETKFGVPYPRLRSSAEAIDRFLSPTCSVGLRIGKTGNVEVYAPYGLDDLFALSVRPNRMMDLPDRYAAKAARWRREWPRITVEPWSA